MSIVTNHLSRIAGCAMRWADRVSLRVGNALAAISSEFGIEREEDALKGDLKEVVEITPAYWKFTDIVVAVLHAAGPDGEVTTAEIVKAVYLADIAQLNDLGRPISFDVYKALPHGPVGSELYRFLLAQDGDPIVGKTHGVKWSRTHRADIGNGTDVFHSPTSEPDTASVLARDDVRALAAALLEVRRLGYFKTRAKVHRHKAYRKAWRDEAERKAFRMLWADMLEVPDPAVIEHLGEMSAQWRSA